MAPVHLARRNFAGKRHQIDRLALTDQSAPLQARRVEELGDQRREPAGFLDDAADAAEIRRCRGLLLGAALQELGLRDEGRERRLEIVRGG